VCGGDPLELEILIAGQQLSDFLVHSARLRDQRNPTLRTQGEALEPGQRDIELVRPEGIVDERGGAGPQPVDTDGAVSDQADR